jgi:2-methylcitrate dehydratase PrpD
VLTKGHAGVAVLPTVLAFADALHQLDGQEFLTQIVIGYEIATRAGIALHATACDYHTSGAWNTIACAALGARNLQLDPQQTLEAMGIAEYHGPRSQMMRCIDYPTMVKDGSGWGAMTGISAALLAQEGFTGAPALTVQESKVASSWADLGLRWRILDQYFKPYPVCRWAQPAVEAAMDLARAHRFRAEDISGIEVWTFHEACRLATRVPTSTEQAQYSLPFSVAAALRHGRLGAPEVANHGLEDPLTHKLSTAMALHEHKAYNELFPAERWAHVRVNLQDGTQLDSLPTIARGNPENPLSADDIDLKYFAFSDTVLGPVRARQIADLVAQLGFSDTALAELLELTLSSTSPQAN